jgi:hypothetical protein
VQVTGLATPCRLKLYTSVVYTAPRDLKNFAIVIFALCLLEALCYFWSGWWVFSLFRSAGATTSQAFEILKDEWTTGFLILIGGLLHWIRPRLRLPLAVAGLFGGVYGAYYLLKTTHLISWNILHDGIIAAGKWREIILIVLAIVCAVELAIMVKGTK